MNKTTSREENVYEEMQAAEEKRQATTRHEYAWKKDRVVLRRMLFVVAAVAVVALLIAIAALILALTAKNLRNDSTAKGQATNKNCGEWYKSGERNSRVYTIDPDGSGAFDVFCDQSTAGGGWTVFQKRLDGSVDFYRGWADYKRGFGNLNGEFWLGLDKIHRLTSSKKYKLRVDLQNMAGGTAFAEYGLFAVGSEGNKYQLNVGSYTGAAGDRLTYHNGYPFSTKDQDNDSNGGNCAVSYKGAWWYNNCFYSNLNGGISDGWSTISSLKRAAMKIRPVDF